MAAKLRHVAFQVPDLEKAAAFYEGSLGLTRVGGAESPIGNSVMLSDGTVNITLLKFPVGKGGEMNGPDWAGVHHVGFVVEDEEATAAKIEDAGGKFFMRLPEYPGVEVEAKFKDPFGVVFDISEHDWTLQSKAAQA